MRRLAILVICALLGGCVSSGTKVDQAKAEAFERGHTTYSEVVKALGAPNAEVTANDGSKTVIYAYTAASPRAQNFIPYVGLLVSKSDVSSQNYTFRFDPAGVLQSVANGTSNTTASFGLLQ